MLGIEGLVSKRNDRAYRAGVSPNWLKVKNPEHSAMMRVKESNEAHPARQVFGRTPPPLTCERGG
jgi:ATP-dependent DNA ligase